MQAASRPVKLRISPDGKVSYYSARFEFVQMRRALAHATDPFSSLAGSAAGSVAEPCMPGHQSRPLAAEQFPRRHSPTFSLLPDRQGRLHQFKAVDAGRRGRYAAATIYRAGRGTALLAAKAGTSR